MRRRIGAGEAIKAAKLATRSCGVLALKVPDVARSVKQLVIDAGPEGGHGVHWRKRP
ncbi:hypothetical protein ACFXB3_09515 [Streptomyces sp. NPDC059447]|uniref:hypothetical protein n=1 Tax=Streptomyces sp. NPDC059447 TaxID=3346834 RepID=UPI0036938A84